MANRKNQGIKSLWDNSSAATRLATSAPFYRYLTESIFQQSAFVQSGILATDSRMNNLSGVRVELPFFNPLDYTEESVDSSATWGTNGLTTGPAFA